MEELIQRYRDSNGNLAWNEVLELIDDDVRTISIDVIDESNNDTRVAGAGLTWISEGKELEISKIEVDDKHRGKGIGTLLLEMVIAIAKFYRAEKITGTIGDGEIFRWYWFAKHGFTIYEVRKLLMEFGAS
jgi:ribosomal protein S18 acetylase RimI-like enzyme